jgi:hypothetical protein
VIPAFAAIGSELAIAQRHLPDIFDAEILSHAAMLEKQASIWNRAADAADGRAPVP